MCLVFLGSGFETWRRIFMSCVLQPGTAGATQHLSQGFFWAQLLVPQKHFKWSRPSLRIFSVTNALVCFCVHSYYCCDCIDVRWKVLFLCEVQAKAYAKVPVYPPTQTPLFSCEVTVCVRICCVDIFQKWAWYCPPQFGQQFTCVGFCDTKQEMWSRWRQKKKKSLANVSSAGVLQCPALATLSLLVVDGTAAGWKKNCFSNQCCGINEFDVVKSTSSLVWMFANSFK